MKQIVISLERGPGDNPVGQVTTEVGQIIFFTGWLHLIRLLEEQLEPEPAGSQAPPDSPEPG